MTVYAVELSRNDHTETPFVYTNVFQAHADFSLTRAEVLPPSILDELKAVASETVKNFGIKKDNKTFYLLMDKEANKAATPIAQLLLNPDGSRYLFDFQMIQFGSQLIRLNILAFITVAILSTSQAETAIPKLIIFAAIYGLSIAFTHNATNDHAHLIRIPAGTRLSDITSMHRPSYPMMATLMGGSALLSSKDNQLALTGAVLTPALCSMYYKFAAEDNRQRFLAAPGRRNAASRDETDLAAPNALHLD